MIYIQKELPRYKRAPQAKKTAPTPRVIRISMINPPISYRTLKSPSVRRLETKWFAGIIENL